MGQSSVLSEQRAKRLDVTAAEMDTERRAISDKAREQEATRDLARPTAPDLKPPPSTKARAFLEPGDSVLGQLQTVMQGIGTIAMGIMGTKGRGYAIAATAALKGAAEGWQQGDADRVRRSLVEWQANHTRLMDQYTLERDAFNDLLTNQKLSMDDRFSQLRLRAEIMGIKDLADQARQQNLGAILDYLGKLDKSQLDHEKAAAELKKWQSESEHRKFLETNALANQQALAAHRKVTERQGDDRLKLAQDNAASVLKLEREDDSIGNSLRSMTALEESIKRLDAKGVIPKGGTAVDKMKASFALQTSVGDEQVAQDIENVKRIGTALLVGSEVAAGLSPSVARLKVVGEAEAAGATAIPKSFWDPWMVRQREAFADRRKTIRGHLHARSGAQGGKATDDEDVILETTP